MLRELGELQLQESSFEDLSNRLEKLYTQILSVFMIKSIWNANPEKINFDHFEIRREMGFWGR